jgi:hypothetical protein
MCCHDNRAAAIEIIVQQRVVELFAIQDVEAKRRLIEHEQSRVDCHHDGEMQCATIPFDSSLTLLVRLIVFLPENFPPWRDRIAGARRRR